MRISPCLREVIIPLRQASVVALFASVVPFTRALERASAPQLFSCRYAGFGFARVLELVRLLLIGLDEDSEGTNQLGFVRGDALDGNEEDEEEG